MSILETLGNYIAEKIDIKQTKRLANTYPTNNFDWNAIRVMNPKGFEEIRCIKCNKLYAQSLDKKNPPGILKCFNGAEHHKPLKCCGGWIIHPTCQPNATFWAHAGTKKE